MVGAIKYWMVVSAARLFAFFSGGRIIVLRLEPRDGNYSYVCSPDLPGFAMVLQPGEADSVRALIDALTDPLMAYLEAEHRRLSAIEAHRHAAAQRPVLRGWTQLNNKVIAAASCV
jgi:hypothetical protein